MTEISKLSEIRLHQIRVTIALSSTNGPETDTGMLVDLLAELDRIHALRLPQAPPVAAQGFPRPFVLVVGDQCLPGAEWPGGRIALETGEPFGLMALAGTVQELLAMQPDGSRIEWAPEIPKPCRWPACLSEAEQQQVADDVGASMRGEETAPGPDPRPGCGCVDRGPDLTREELQDLADDQSTDLYRAQDLLAFIREMCDMHDASGRPVTTTDVRGWLGYTGCGGVLVLPEETVAKLAQHGVTTPGCDCGHEGMGESWHRRDCAWRAAAEPLPIPATQVRPTAWPEDGSVPWGGNGQDCPYCVQPDPPRGFLCPGHPAGTVASPATPSRTMPDKAVSSSDAPDIALPPDRNTGCER